jgi:hypothetical protein
MLPVASEKDRYLSHGMRSMGKRNKKTTADGTTTRAETPEFEGRMPLPEEITGLASAGDDNLAALFDNPSAAHLTDGFRGGSEDESDPEDGPKQAT